jgi:hypothetical protein
MEFAARKKWIHCQKRMIVISSSIALNVFGLGEGGLVGHSILAVYFCPLLPNPCCRLFFGC